jgi:hypothetical protein
MEQKSSQKLFLSLFVPRTAPPVFATTEKKQQGSRSKIFRQFWTNQKFYQPV